MNEFEPPEDVTLWRYIIALALLGTVTIGFWLRWSLAGAWELTLDFSHLRHAHSHLGYFGLLFPLAWLGWRRRGASIPGPYASMLYALCTAVTCLGFAFDGYGPVAIAGSTFIATCWIWSAVGLLRDAHESDDPLGVVPWGIFVSLLCIPPIALSLRSDPELAREFVSTFLAGLLLLVIVPSAVAGRHISLGPWPLLFATGLSGALFLGVAEHPVTRIGLLAHAGLLLALIRSTKLGFHTRCVWGVVSFGLGAMALNILPNTRPVALGAIHFLILGPVLATLAPLWFRCPLPEWVWWLGHASWGGMSAALIAQEFITSPWTWKIAAIGGTMTALWWMFALIYQWSAANGWEPTHQQRRPPHPHA